MITKQDVDNMSPEELEELKREASVALAKKFAALVLFKVSMHLAIRQLSKRWGR